MTSCISTKTGNRDVPETFWQCIGVILLVLFTFVGLSLLFPNVSALPTTGAAGDITSNSVNISVTGITGTDVWIVYGQLPDYEIWISSNYTPTVGAATVRVWSSPLLGSTLYYAKACDSTGCGNEISFTTAVITPVPTTNYGAGFRNISQSHYNIMVITPQILQGYFNIMPASIFFGLFFGAIVIGLWRRNRGVRLVSVVMIIISPMIMSSSAGLMMGIPLVEQALGQALLAAGIAGILLSFVKK